MNSRKLLPRVLLLAISIVLSWGAAEIILRVLDHRVSITSEWVLDTEWRVLDSDVILIHQCFKSEDHYRLEDPELPTIVTLGDSFTRGFPVPEELSYPALLEQLLAEGGFPVNVINMGLGDSGSDRHLRLLTDFLLPRIDPAIVIWTFYPNDIWDNVSAPAYDIQGDELVRLNGNVQWMAQRQRFYRAFPLPGPVKMNSYLFRLLLKAFEDIGIWLAVPAGFRDDPSCWSLAKINREMREIERLGESHGFLVYYALIAPEAMYLAADNDEWLDHWTVKDYHRLAELLGDGNFVNLFFDDSDMDTLFAGSEIDPQLMGDHHCAEPGYRLIAEKLAERLLADLPEGGI